MVILEKSLRKKIENNELLVGSWITLAHPSIAEIMASAGFDWLCIDLEHSSINISQAEELIRIVNLSGVSPLVRLTSNNSDQIKRVMDSGSEGIIVPMVNSVQDARSAVHSAYYPPIGNRGFGLSRAHSYGIDFEEYLEWQTKNTTIIVQIEHIDAVDNFEEILQEDGVNGFIVGPYDLSGSLGIPGQFDHPKMMEAMSQINEVAKRNLKPGGIHIVEPNPHDLSRCIEDGNKFIAYSLDTRMIDTASRAGLEVIK